MRLAQDFIFRPRSLPIQRAAPEPAHAHDLRDARDALARSDPEGALAAFDRALAKRPSLKIALAGRLVALASMGRTVELIDAIEDDLLNDRGDVIIELARASVAAGHVQLALDVLAIVSDHDPALCAPLADDAAFSSLRDHPLFLQLIGLL